MSLLMKSDASSVLTPAGLDPAFRIFLCLSHQPNVPEMSWRSDIVGQSGPGGPAGQVMKFSGVGALVVRRTNDHCISSALDAPGGVLRLDASR